VRCWLGGEHACKARLCKRVAHQRLPESSTTPSLHWWRLQHSLFGAQAARAGPHADRSERLPDTYSSAINCCSQGLHRRLWVGGRCTPRRPQQQLAPLRAGRCARGRSAGRTRAGCLRAPPPGPALRARGPAGRILRRPLQSGPGSRRPGACGMVDASSPACSRARRRGTAGRSGSPRQGREPGRARTGDRARRQQAPARQVVRVQHLGRPPQPGLHARPHQLADRLRVARVAVQAHHRLHLRAGPQTLSCVGTTACIGVRGPRP